MMALQKLHDYFVLRQSDARHCYLRCDEDIARGLVEWQADCAAYDAHPADWKRRRSRTSLRSVSRERPDLALAYAAFLVAKGKDALSLVCLYAAVKSSTFEPAAVRWLGRLSAEGRDVTLGQLQLAAAPLGELRGRRHDAGRQ